jgi:hypothetical protein
MIVRIKQIIYIFFKIKSYIAIYGSESNFRNCWSVREARCTGRGKDWSKKQIYGRPVWNSNPLEYVTEVKCSNKVGLVNLSEKM